MAGLEQGQDYRLYVASSAPATDFDPQDAVWDLVGFSTDTGMTLGKDLIETSNKSTAYDETHIAGRRSGEGSETVYAETEHAASSEGQELLWTSYNSDDQSIYFLISNDVSGDFALQGQVYVSEIDFTATDQEIVELDISYTVTGGVSRGATV